MFRRKDDPEREARREERSKHKEDKIHKQVQGTGSQEQVGFCNMLLLITHNTSS